MSRKGASRKVAALGFGCDVWTDPPGHVWADFVHDVDEIVMLIEGEIEVSFGGEDAPPTAGRGDRARRARATPLGTPGPIDKWPRTAGISATAWLGSRMRDHLRGTGCAIRR